MVAIVVVDDRKPRYYTMITSSVLGPDSAMDLGWGTQDPEFNFTLTSPHGCPPDPRAHRGAFAA
jgi:hypothetical protein